MSSHSRSSSELDTGNVKDILPALIDEFKKDFDFADVQNTLNYLSILSKDSIQAIQSETDQNKRVHRLIWILTKSEDRTKKFLDIIEQWYSWLTKKAYQERDDPSKSTRSYLFTAQQLQSRYPKFLDYNVHRMRYFMSLHSALRKLKPSNFVVLSGELGIGKKWLTVDVCSDYQVMSAMDFKIFWIDVGKCNSREEDFRALQQFKILLDEGNFNGKCFTSNEIDGIDNKILQLQQSICSRLQEKSLNKCLLVLVNVQNTKICMAFNLNCKVLIITKNKKVSQSFSQSMAKIIRVDHGFTKTECFELFENMLQRKYDQLPCNFADLFLQTDGHPFVLSIVAHHLKSIPVNKWVDWMEQLKDIQKSNKFTTIVKTSLNFLSDSERKLYNMLVIFPHSKPIPVQLLAALWDKTENETHIILSKFNKHFLINHEQMTDGNSAMMMYIYSTYLESNVKVNEMELHNRVVRFYRVDDILKGTMERNLFPNDVYFFQYIGYHLLNSENIELMGKLFLDFRFLEQKLRVDCLSNTIGDLNNYKDQIIGKDSYRERLLKELIEYLPSIEHILSEDTSLIQYALMSSGIVKDEAKQQARAFPHKIWFIEKGRFHRCRQMVRLQSKPKRILLLDADTCLINLETNDILLLDISLGYNSEPVLFTGNQCAIVKMELMFRGNYMVTLDSDGNLKVWNIVDDRCQSARGRASDRTKVSPLNLTKRSEMLKRKCRQEIQSTIILGSPITTFYIESQKHLHVSCKNCIVFAYKWNTITEQFDLESMPRPKTSIIPAYLFKVFHFYMVLDSEGQMQLYDLRDSSNAGKSFEWKPKSPLVCTERYQSLMDTDVIYFVHTDQVVRLTMPVQKADFLQGNLEEIYEINMNDLDNVMTCACLSQDRRYLVLGTKRGLIVIDTKQKIDVLRGNLSEHITCVNIYSIDDKIFKYIIICGSKDSNILNLYGLKQRGDTITWSFRYSYSADVGGANAVNEPQLEPEVFLQGGKLFSIQYDDSVLLTVADSKNRIHQLCTADTNNWSISKPLEISSRITVLTANYNLLYCAYENGDIFNITRETLEPTFTKEGITFLQFVDDNTLVASSKTAKQSMILQASDDASCFLSDIIDTDINKVFKLFDSYLLLVDHQCGFKILNRDNKFKPEKFPARQINGYSTGGCDFKNNHLFLATGKLYIFVYRFSLENGNLKMELYAKFARFGNHEVTCLASSSDASLVAAGLQNGRILLFQMDRDVLKEIFYLDSHKYPIYDLKFSPNNEILVSCSEQLCFWHVPYMQNNPINTESTCKRRSSRFASDNSPLEEIADLTIVNNPWSNRRGPLSKPELLSCIKFSGNKAEVFFANEDFTQFNTIDNEGAYYHLCVYDASPRTDTSDRIDQDDNGFS